MFQVIVFNFLSVFFVHSSNGVNGGKGGNGGTNAKPRRGGKGKPSR